MLRLRMQFTVNKMGVLFSPTQVMPLPHQINATTQHGRMVESVPPPFKKETSSEYTPHC